MDSIHQVIQCFLRETRQGLTVSETFSECIVFAQGTVAPQFSPSDIKRAFDALPAEGFVVTLTLEGQDAPYTLSVSDIGAIETFLAAVRAAAELTSVAVLKLYLEKGDKPAIAVFSPEHFFAWINGLELTDLLQRFDELIRHHSTVSFIHPAFENGAVTASLRFMSRAGTLGARDSGLLRNQEQAARREQVVSDWGHLSLFPDDFQWKSGIAVPELAGAFAKLENFLAAISLADYTGAAERGFAVRIKSHVLREETLLWSQLPAEPNIALRHLFAWCYRESGVGPLSDKLGLARNYMSLYWEGSISSIDIKVVSAVRAGFSLFLKRNLKDFVELRAKVASFLLELDAKATKSVENATANLEKNLYGVVTFITSVVLIKAIQDKTFTGAFSHQVALLGWILIGFSLLHALYAWRSVTQEMTRATALYDDLRQLYQAFFSEKDFDSIFSTHGKTPIEKAQAYVRSRLKGVMCIWILTLLIAAGLIFYLRQP